MGALSWTWRHIFVVPATWEGRRVLRPTNLRLASVTLGRLHLQRKKGWGRAVLEKGQQKASYALSGTWCWGDLTSHGALPEKEPPLGEPECATALLNFIFSHLSYQAISSRLWNRAGTGKTLSVGDCVWNERKNMGQGKNHSADVNFGKCLRSLWTHDNRSKKTDLCQIGRKLTCKFP